MSKNNIYRAITSFGNVKREVKKANNYNNQEDNKLKVDLSNNVRETKKVLIENEIDNLQDDNKLRVQQLIIKQESKNGSIFMLLSFIASIISAIFSICGLNGVVHLSDAIKDVPSIMITTVFLFFAIVNLIISYYESFHSINYYKQYSKFKIFQFVFLMTSISSNYIFLTMQGVNKILSIVLSCLLDLASIYCSEIANARKYKNKSVCNENNENATISDMLKKIFSYKVTRKIKSRYDEIINEEIAYNCKLNDTATSENFKSISSNNVIDKHKTYDKNNDNKIVPIDGKMGVSRNCPLEKNDKNDVVKKNLKVALKEQETQK